MLALSPSQTTFRVKTQEASFSLSRECRFTCQFTAGHRQRSNNGKKGKGVANGQLERPDRLRGAGSL